LSTLPVRLHGAAWALAPLVALLLLPLTAAWPGIARAVTPPMQAEQDALQAYDQARQALAASQWDQAELLLERVLMLMPEHAEARLDFALLLARRGQPDAARALILGLAQDARTPTAYAAYLRALAARLPGGTGEMPGEAPNAATARARERSGDFRGGATAGGLNPSGLRPAPQALWRAETALAGSTNPLARTGAEGVVLTLPDGPVTLPLATRPQAATVAGISLLRVQGNGGLDLSVQQMDRTDTATAYRAAAWGQWPAQAWPVWVQRAGLGAPQWHLQTLRGFDSLRRHAAALALPLPLQPAAGAQRVVLGTYAEPAQQDRGWLLRIEHQSEGPSGSARTGTSGNPWGLQWQASAERSASSARAQGYWRLNLALEAPLGPGRRLQAQVTAQEDTHPYSPLLENNSRRRLLTTYLGVEQQLPLGGGHDLILRGFTTQRASNLSLFEFRDTGAQIAVARRW
jgi:hypothetical protein